MTDGHRKPLLGFTYLLVLALLIGASIVAYRKDFPWQHATPVTMTADAAGLELNVHSDVKLQGVRVGDVRSIESNGRTATIKLGLDDDRLNLIPANVDAAIVPKTLFGEKFVDLQIPDHPVSARMAAGGFIRQTSTSIEVGKLFSRLLPMLESLRPEKLSVVLSSMAEAVDGRGEQVARAMNQLSAYLEQMEPHLNTMGYDFQQLAKTIQVYADSSPDIIRLLDESTGISDDLLVPKREKFADFLDGVMDMADREEKVLRENSGRLVALSGKSRPVLALFDEYDKSLACSITGLRILDAIGNQAVGTQGPFMNLRYDLEVVRSGFSHPADLPTTPTSDAHNTNLPPEVHSWDPHCPYFSAEQRALRTPGLYSQPIFDFGGAAAAAGRASAPTATPTGTASPSQPEPAPLPDEPDTASARDLASRLTDLPEADVPPYAPLIVNPLLRNGEVVGP